MSQIYKYLHTTKASQYGKGMICTNIALLYLFTSFISFVNNIRYNLTDFKTEYYKIHLMNSKENEASF